jgi:hypothetical protein
MNGILRLLEFDALHKKEKRKKEKRETAKKKAF